MNVLWFEFMLSLRRLARRKTQNGLMLLTFAVSLTLSLLSWSLFHTVFLRQPDFDRRGEYLVLALVDSHAKYTCATQAEMEAIKAGPRIFSDFAEVNMFVPAFIRTPDGSERSLAAYLSSGALRVFGAQPLMGRLFTQADDKFRAPATALLSQRMWEDNYSSDPNILGKTVEVTGDPVTIVGVMPASFRLPNDQDLWLSYGSAPDLPRWPMRDALVKLDPAVSREQAEKDLQIILQGLGPESPANKYGFRPVLVPFRDYYLESDVKVSALILFALSLIFLAVSCANAANLMLIDFLGRRPEVAAALALGVPRGAAIRGVCFQVAVIATGAAVLGIALLPVAGPLLYSGLKMVSGPYWLRYRFEWADIGVAFGLAAISGLATVVAPIVYLLWTDADRVIREHAYASRGSGRAWWRRLLLTGQIALLTVLGISSGLLVRSSYHVGTSHWGYPAAQVFMGKLSVLSIDYGKTRWGEARLKSLRGVLDQVELRPETVAAALASDPPGYSATPNCTYALDPAAFSHQAQLGEAYNPIVTEHYLDALDVPFVAGREFPRDNPEGGPAYAIINESLAARLWPGQDPLQRAFYVRRTWMNVTDPPAQLVVCGVVRNFQAAGPLAKNNDCILTPYTPKTGASGTVFLFVRDRVGLPTTRSLTDAVHRADPRISLYFPSTIGAQIDLTLNSMRLTAHLTTLFAAAAFLLCAIGVYSLTVAQVLQSSREFGIRMALGAEPRRLWRDFTRGHLVAALIGVAVGLVGATQLVRVLGSLLYGVDPHNLPTYAGVALAILVVAVLACIPSLFRLRRINPADCLRSL